MNLLGLFVDKGFLSASDRAKVEAELAKKRPLAEVLAEYGVSLENALSEAGKTYNIPARILGDPPADENAFSYVPIDSARHYGFVPLDMVDAPCRAPEKFKIDTAIPSDKECLGSG